jgi:hypothetical protein
MPDNTPVGLEFVMTGLPDREVKLGYDDFYYA